jgi:hypothetical protein
LNAFAAFREQASFADLQMPADPLLANKAFALEDKGSVRVLDFSTSAVTLDRTFALDASGGLPSGAAAASLTISDAHTALVATNGAESVYAFDPTSAKTASDVTKILDLSQTQVNWSTARTDSQGNGVAQSMPVSFTASAILSANKLFVATSNLNAAFAYNPGTIIAYDASTSTLVAKAVIETSSFDPTRLTRWTGNGAEALLCVNAGVGSVTTQTGTVDVINPVSAAIVATIPVPGHPGGAVAISADGKRGFVGSMSTSEVFELDLSNLDQELANTTAATESTRFVGSTALAGSGLHFISSVALSASGTYLYAVDFNTSELSVVDISAGPGKGVVVGTVTGFQRSGDPSKYEGNADFVVVRPGNPGVDFKGPAVFVGTIGLVAADQTVPNVTIALDAVAFDKN